MPEVAAAAVVVPKSRLFKSTAGVEDGKAGGGVEEVTKWPTL